MAFELFKPTYRTIQNPIDLNVLASTYNTLEKGHQQAVDTSAAYITALGDLPVNEAERPYIQKHINSIQETLNNEKIYGNAYAALDDIKLLGAKISTDPGIKARIKAEAAYQNYMKVLDADKTISEADKEFFRVHNKYYYQDKYDEKGNVIGGTEWIPQKRHVAAPDMVGMMAQALKIAASEGGSSNTVYYKDANGNYTPNQNASVDKIPYYSIQGKYERLPKDRIRAALNTVIANTDGAIEGLQQDFEIAKWRHNKPEGLVVDETTDDKGLPLNFEQYLEKRFSGFYHTASYSRYYEGNITPLAGMQMEIARSKANTKGSKGDKTVKNWSDLLDLTPTTQSGYRTTRSNAIAATVAGYTAAAETLKGMADRMEVEWNPDDVQGSYDNLVKKFGANLPKEVYDAYKKYQTNINKFNQIMPKGSMDTQAIIFGSNLLAGVDMSQLNDNKYAKLYTEFTAKLYNNGNLIIPVTDANGKRVKDIDYKSLGLELKYDNKGGMYFESDIKDSNNLYKIAIETQPFRKLDTITIHHPDGRYTQETYKNNTFQSLDEIINMYNESTYSVQNIMNEETYVPLEVVPDTDLIETIAGYKYSTGTFSDMENARKYAESAIRTSIANIYGPSAGFSVGWGNNPASDNLTTEQQFAVAQIIKLAAAEYKNSPSMFGLGYDKSTGDSVINITLGDEFKKSDLLKTCLEQLGASDANNLSIVATNLWNNELKNEILSVPEYAVASEFSTDVYSGVNSWDLENGGRLIRNGDNYYNEYNGIYYPLGGFNEGKAAIAANSLMSDLKYTDLVEKAKGNAQYSNEAITDLATIVTRDILPSYFPGIEPSSSEGLVLINDIINSIINQK